MRPSVIYVGFLDNGNLWAVFGCRPPRSENPAPGLTAEVPGRDDGSEVIPTPNGGHGLCSIILGIMYTPLSIIGIIYVCRVLQKAYVPGRRPRTFTMVTEFQG